MVIGMTRAQVKAAVRLAYENRFYTAGDLRTQSTYVADMAASFGLPVSDDLDGLIAECQKEIATELGLNR